MNRCYVLLIVSALGVPAMSLAQPTPQAGAPRFAVIPQPAELHGLPGSFTFTPQTQIRIEADDPEFRRVADMLVQYVQEKAGFAIAIVDADDPANENPQVVLKTDERPDAPVEGYSLKIEPTRVTLTAATPRGAFYGVQTARQMLQVKMAHKSRRRVWFLSCAAIKDQPRYQWRGMLLDCGRHFMEKDFIKRYIDLLAYHKMNVLHWHLTEDQGWRIEIKKYPKLTEIGAWRNQDGERYGGYYTQEDAKEIIAYAAERFITVVPEIEMPGHSLAALAAYPQFSCTGGPFEVGTKWGIYEDVYCAGNDETFAFLTDVLDEVIDLFPSEYVHIGGDECPKTRWKACEKCQARIQAEGLKDEHELQSHFIKRIEKHVNSRGKRIIGWDEILEGGLAPNATVQSWRGMSGAIAAAKAGHDVIASPTTHCYLDYAQARLPSEHTFGFLTLEQSYAFEPTPAELTPEEAKHILGIEANLWSERAPQHRVDRQVFPRLCALAEVAWSPKEARDYADFTRRMLRHYRRLDKLDVKYFFGPPLMSPPDTVFQRSLRFNLVSPTGLGEIRYTLDGSEPTKASPRFDEPIHVTESTLLRTRSFMRDGRMSDIADHVLRKLRPVAALPELPSIAPGLTCNYYEGEWESLPDFETLQPVATSIVNTIDLTPSKKDRLYALRFKGLINIPFNGRYTFFLKSDGGSRLTLGNDVIIDHDGLHGVEERRGQVILMAGWHRFEIAYFQAGGDAELEVAFDGPRFERMAIPGEIFAHEAK